MEKSELIKLKNKRGLAFYLNLWILPMLITVFGVMLYYNYSVSRDLLVKSVEENTRNLTNSAINKSEGIFSVIEKIALNAKYYFEQGNVSNEEAVCLLQEIVKENDEIFGSCIALRPDTVNGIIKYDAPYCWKTSEGLKIKNLNSESYNYTEADWFSIPYSTHKAIWSEPYYDEGGGDTLMTTFSVPIYSNDNDTNSFIAVLTIDVSLDWLNKIINGIKIFDTGFAFLISPSGNIVAHSDTSLIMDKNFMEIARKSGDKQLTEIATDMMAGNSGFKQLQSHFVREPSWIYYSVLDNNDWSLAFVFPEAELYEDLQVLNRRLLMIFGFGIFLLVIFISYISRKITKPIRTMADLMNKDGENFITDAIPEVLGSSEIETLNKSFRRLQSELIAYISDLDNVNKEKERIESEINIAYKVQQSMLPKFNKSLEFDSALLIDGRLEPAREVGGDFYDFCKIDDKHIYFAIGDVSGKGMGAALFMSIAITLLRAYVKIFGDDICTIINKTSEYLHKNNNRKYFVTMFIGILDVDTGIIQYINAGHNPPIIMRAKENAELISGTHLPPLGIIYKKNQKMGTLQLKANDSILLYTDGLTEALNDKNEMYSLEDLISLLNNIKGQPPIDLINSIKQENLKFANGAEQYDDITMLSIQYNSPVRNAKEVFSKTMTISYEQFESMRIELETILTANGIDAKTLNRLILVLEELVTNIIKYGEYDAANSMFAVSASIIDDEIAIELSDNSAEFDYSDYMNQSNPAQSRKTIGGRGLVLVRKITSNFEYKRINNNNVMKFNIKIEKK